MTCSQKRYTITQIKKYKEEAETLEKKVTKNNVIYYYLVDTKNPTNIKFCYEEKNNNQIELVEIEDKDLIKNLLLNFVENIQLDS